MSRETISYQIHGLRLRSEIPLSARRIEEDSCVDVEIRRGHDMTVGIEPPPGRLVAAYKIRESGYGYSENETGYVARYYSTCEFHIDRELRSIRVHVDPLCDPGLVPLLLSGNLINLLLELAGESVLHASAVERDGSALAFVGRGGMGKSTCAAILCQDGADLVTDDLLRLDVRSGGALFCHRGAPELRLRRHVAHLAARFPEESRGLAADDRITVRFAPRSTPLPRLDVVMIPRPTPGLAQPRFERLGEREAFLELTRYPRTAGWSDPGALKTGFRTLGHVVRSVAVYRAELPWGPPPGSGLANEVNEVWKRARKRACD